MSDWRMLVLLLLQVVEYAYSQSFPLPENVGESADCFSKFPYLRKRFSWEQLEFFCQQKRRFDKIIFNETITPLSENQLEYLNSLAVDYYNEDPPRVIVVRKEIRRLSDTERRDLEQAMKNLKVQTIDGVSKYDLLVMLHHPALSPGAHVGAAFLPWHREYLRRFETALQQINRNIALPYWDSTLDEPLVEPLDSVLWTGIFFGNSKGNIIEGPYSNWGFRPDNTSEIIRLERNAGVNGSLITTKLRDFILSRESYKDLTACRDLTVEQTSRGLHEWVGGAMASIYYSTQDPIFLFHHVYMDFMWGLFRLNQTEEAKRTDYPSNYEACTSYHYALSDMKPFSLPNGLALRNIDGLGPFYGEYYLYEFSPECKTSSAECDSKYLFCHTQLKRCVSKVRPGGNCMTLPDDACFDGKCSGGVCELNFPTEPEVERNVVGRSAKFEIPQRDEPVNAIMDDGSTTDGLVNDSYIRNDTLGFGAGPYNRTINSMRVPNTDPFSGPLVATEKNKQTEEEDVLPSKGRHYKPSPERPKYKKPEEQKERIGFHLELRPNMTEVEPTESGQPENDNVISASERL